MGTVFKRTRRLPNGEIEVAEKHTIVYVDASGRRRYEAAYTDKRSSEQLLAQREREAARLEVGLSDPYAAHRKRPLAEHIAEYAEHLRAKGGGAKHVRNVKGNLESAFSFMGATKIGQIKPGGVERFMLHLGESAGFSKKTVNDYLANLRAFLKWGVRTQRWPNNPIESVRSLKGEDDIRRRRRAFSEEELGRLFEAAETRPVLELVKRRKPVSDEARRRAGVEGRERALAYRLMAYQGLRVNEVRTLTWGALDLRQEPATLTVAAEHAKSKRRDTIPLHDSLTAHLMDWRKEVVVLRGVLPTARERVFRIPLHPERAFARDVEAAGIAELNESGIIQPNDKGEVLDLHCLRHTCSTMLTRAGVAPRVVQAIMRHADLSTTMRTYTHIEVLDMTRGVAALPDVEKKAEKIRAVVNGDPTAAGEVQHICQQFLHARGQERSTSDKTGQGTRKGGIAANPFDIAPLATLSRDVSTGGNKEEMVGVAGFEPATSCSQSRRATKLRHTPIRGGHPHPRCIIHNRARFASVASDRGDSPPDPAPSSYGDNGCQRDRLRHIQKPSQRIAQRIPHVVLDNRLRHPSEQRPRRRVHHLHDLRVSHVLPPNASLRVTAASPRRVKGRRRRFVHASKSPPVRPPVEVDVLTIHEEHLLEEASRSERQRSQHLHRVKRRRSVGPPDDSRIVLLPAVRFSVPPVHDRPVLGLRVTCAIEPIGGMPFFKQDLPRPVAGVSCPPDRSNQPFHERALQTTIRVQRHVVVRFRVRDHPVVCRREPQVPLVPYDFDLPETTLDHLRRPVCRPVVHHLELDLSVALGENGIHALHHVSCALVGKDRNVNPSDRHRFMRLLLQFPFLHSHEHPRK